MKKLFLSVSLVSVCLTFQAQTIFLQQDFSTASGTTPPAGWTVQTTIGDPLVDVWQFDNPGRRSPASPVAGKFACFDSDKLSNNSQAEEVYLISPAFNAATTDKIIMEFDQYFMGGYGAVCTVEVFNGTSWVSVYNNSTTTFNPQHSTFDITTIVQNKTSARVRFKWTGNYSWFWIIDNIKIAAQPVITEQFTEQTGIVLTGVTSSSVAWGDYDNDGDLDILLTGSSTSVPISKIYRNNGDNTFTEQTGIVLTGVSGSTAWGDYNNDGDLDILLTGVDASNNGISKIYRNNGNNTFTEQTGIALTGVAYCSAAWGDYDNDGDLDILLTGSSDPGLSNLISKIYRNNGDNTFTEQPGIALTGVVWGSVAWGDYDNDGDLDILLTGYFQNYPYYISKIYRNNGDNSFTEQTGIALTGVYSGSVAWGDYDNDGDLDIILTGSTSSGNISKIYRNNGDNTFTEQTGISLTGVYNSSVAWADYDNDGDLDILLSGTKDGYSSGAVTKIYRNNGDNTFTEQTGIALTGVKSSSVAWGDYDNDGDLDILLTGHYGIFISKIYKNNNSIKNTPPIAPSGLSARLTNKKLMLTWDKATDKETPQPGLTYNLRIGTTPGGCEILSPMSLLNGKRTIAAFGNAGHNTKWTIDLSYYSPLPEHFYYSVQAIDNGFLASEWSPEKSEISDFVADFLPNTVCQKAEIQFLEKSYSIQYPVTTYQWKFTEGTIITTSSFQNPLHIFQTSGSHKVVLTITNSNNETTSLTKTITVLPSPLADFTATNVCQGVPVVLDNTTNANTTTITSWLWSFGDNTPNSVLEEPGSHGYLNAGDYLVTLKDSAVNGCTGSISKTVTVANYPVAEITTNSPLKFCKGDSATLSVSYNYNYAYKWLLDGTYLTGADSNKYVAKLSGNFAVEVVNTKANCKTTSSQVTVTAQNSPGAPLIIPGGPTQFCQNDSVTLNVTNTAGYTYQWRLNGGTVGSNSNQLIAKNAGNYTIVVSNSIGCSVASANTVSIALNEPPHFSSVSLRGSTEFCEGDSLTMSVTLTTGYSYQWMNVFGPVTGKTGNIFSAKNSGPYSLKISNEKGCQIISPPINVTVKSIPAIPNIVTENYQPGKCIIESPITLRVDQPINGYSYVWKRNGIPMDQSNLTYIEGYLSMGDYTVEVTSNGCKNESKSQTIYFDNAPEKPIIYAQGPTVWYLACSNDSAIQYKWYFNGTEIPGADRYLYVANQNLGQYYVRIANSKGCFTASDVINIPSGATGIDNIDPFEGLKIYPNPASGLFTIEMNNQIFGELMIKIITPEGKQALNIKFEKTTEHFSRQIDLSGQAKGVYVVNLLMDKYFAVRKVIVE